MKTWGAKKYSFEKRIWLVLKSPRVAFWRIVGKEAQTNYMHSIKTCDDLESLLGKIVSDYETAINNIVCMNSRERRVKLNNLHRYAEGRY